MKKQDRRQGQTWKFGKYAACVMAGVLCFLAAELVDMGRPSVENGVLKRNSCGQGEAVYEIVVDGLEETEVGITVTVPEQKLTAGQLENLLPDVMALLSGRIVGKNESLFRVTENLELEKEIPEYGLTVKWESEDPEVISNMGIVQTEGLPEEGKTVYLSARLSNGIFEEQVEIPVTVFPVPLTASERFLQTIEEVLNQTDTEEYVTLPQEFEGNKLSYQNRKRKENIGLIFLGILAAVCLALKEKNDRETAKKVREDRLIRDYPELITRFLVLVGAGYPAKQAWKKQVEDHKSSMKNGRWAEHPVYEEMQITLNQMDTGMPEVRAYREFGRRLGVRCYVKFASLLESYVYTGGKDLRKLLEAEVEEAFQQRTDLAKRKGEEASTRLLIPMFLMLGVVMVMIVTPAFLTLG